MTRRRRLPAGTEQTETNPPQPAGRATMRVELSGDPDQVRSKMNLNQKEPAVATPTSDENDKKFFAAIENPEYRFRVRRTRPTQWKGRDARHVVYEENCPMTYQDIVDEVGKTSGGQQYLITTFDPGTGKTIAGKTFRVDSDPIMKEEAQPDNALEDMLSQEAEPDAIEAMQQTMKRQLSLAETQAALERTQEMIEGFKRKRNNGQNVDNTQIQALEKQLTDLRHQRDLDLQKAESDRRLALMEERLNSLSKAPPPTTGKSELTTVMETMIKMQDESNKRFERLLESQRQDKLDLILQNLNKNSAAGGLGSLKEQVATVKQIRDLFDGGGGEEGDDAEPKEWYEKLIDQVPKILEKLGDMSKDGKKVSKEDFLKEIDEATERATKEELAKIQQEQDRKRPALPGPAPSSAEPAKPQVGRPLTPAHVQGLPGTSSSAAPATAAVEVATKPVDALPAAAPEAPAPTVDAPSIEKESLLMVTGVIVAIGVEIEMRKNFYQWNYEGAWQNLPEDILERMCKAPDALSMLEALRVDGLPPEVVVKLDAIKAKVSGAPRAGVWISRGFKELQRWWEEREKDPEFDPGDEDEEQEEQPEE
jgi:hypothetical protein